MVNKTSEKYFPQKNTSRTMNFSLEFKLQVVEEAKKADNNHVVAKKHKIDESMIRNWRKKESKMREKAKNSIRKTRFTSLDGGSGPKKISNNPENFANR